MFLYSREKIFDPYSGDQSVFVVKGDDDEFKYGEESGVCFIPGCVILELAPEDSKTLSLLYREGEGFSIGLPKVLWKAEVGCGDESSYESPAIDVFFSDKSQIVWQKYYP